MSNKNVRVLVVDDSATLREIICDLIAEADGMEVAGTAGDGKEALKKIAELKPDIVSLDVQMPRMDGLQTLEAILETNPTPVIMVSSLTQRAAEVTLQALELGALDYVAKPEKMQDVVTIFRDQLLSKLKMMAGSDVRRVLRIRKERLERQRTKVASSAEARTAAPAKGTVADAKTASERAYENCCVAIGISTGGPPALLSLFQTLTPPLPAIAIVQHMPADFTGPFAQRLDLASELSVREAKTGDILTPNLALVAPGGRHMHLVRRGGKVVVNIRDEERVCGHAPSVDVMMKDAANVYREHCLGVIMTGMGHDGVDGCAAIRAASGYVLGQDEASSDVYGMNKVAHASGHVNAQFCLNEAAATIERQCRKMFRLQAVH